MRSPDQDRRQHRRVPEIFIVAYQLKAIVPMSAVAESKEFAGVGIDISEVGLGIELAEPMTEGVLAQVRFRLINDLCASPEHRERMFRLEGECRYCEPTSKGSFHAGFHFVGATNEDREFIAAYVKDQALAKIE